MSQFFRSGSQWANRWSLLGCDTRRAASGRAIGRLWITVHMCYSERSPRSRQRPVANELAALEQPGGHRPVPVLASPIVAGRGRHRRHRVWRADRRAVLVGEAYVALANIAPRRRHLGSRCLRCAACRGGNVSSPASVSGDEEGDGRPRCCRRHVRNSASSQIDPIDLRHRVAFCVAGPRDHDHAWTRLAACTTAPLPVT